MITKKQWNVVAKNNNVDYHIIISVSNLITVCFQNEDTLKKCVADYQMKLKKQEDKYQTLKKHAEEKIEQYVFSYIYIDEVFK